ncbi:MAG: hypothetical protein RBR19_17040 [Sedimentisphaerales bacterium]|jgi:hypothetical protein|nr:hypothetical protein [Planctomycetota bacterium]MDY0357590.1 hypothetical protein [Sedimentisphaerales bacterium]
MEHDKPQLEDVGRPWRRRIALAILVILALALAVSLLCPTRQGGLAATGRAENVET